MSKKLVLGALALAVVAAAPALAIDRVSASEKGSLLIFSKVDIRWDASGNVIQDTFIDLTNDYPADVSVQMYFVNGDGCDYHFNGSEGGQSFEPSCNSVDVGIRLTQNEPTYWSALTGLPKGVSPFTILDPGPPPGRPDPNGTGDRVLRGYVIAWAVDLEGREIKWNHLKGDATIVNYLDGSAWEYNAFAFQTGTAFSTATNGALLASPYGTMLLNGSEYEPGFDLLLLDFYATGSTSFSGPVPVTVDTDLTLYPLNMDLRQETDGPTTTKATFTVWNQYEFKLTGMDRCITCWDQALVSTYGIPNHFLLVNLQTNKGKAQIDGLASQLCNYDYDDDDNLPLGGDPRDIVSIASPLLGVAAKYLSFSRGAEFASAGTTLVGMGTQSATILSDVVSSPPPEQNPGKAGRKPVKAQASDALGTQITLE
jgi:hypothetical protein